MSCFCYGQDRIVYTDMSYDYRKGIVAFILMQCYDVTYIDCSFGHTLVMTQIPYYHIVLTIEYLRLYLHVQYLILTPLSIDQTVIRKVIRQMCNSRYANRVQLCLLMKSVLDNISPYCADIFPVWYFQNIVKQIQKKRTSRGFCIFYYCST